MKKKEETYLHHDKDGRPFFTNEPPHIKKWCEQQLELSRKRKLRKL